MIDKKNNYWKKFYDSLNASNEKRMPPSQFAAFCRTELKNLNINELIELASGDGRDSIFFAEEGLNVCASDKNSTAINLLKKKTSHLKNISVKKIDVTKVSFQKTKIVSKPCAYYARFLLHTLEINQLKRFFNNLTKVMKKSDYFFTEFRNEKDKNRKKVTPKHFRKFYSSDYVSSIAYKNNLSCIYQVEGIGFAKWRDDDAFVSRQIYIKYTD